MDVDSTLLVGGAKHPKEVFSSDGHRLDGRAFEEFRRVCEWQLFLKLAINIFAIINYWNNIKVAIFI